MRLIWFQIAEVLATTAILVSRVPLPPVASSRPPLLHGLRTVIPLLDYDASLFPALLHLPTLVLVFVLWYHMILRPSIMSLNNKHTWSELSSLVQVLKRERSCSYTPLENLSSIGSWKWKISLETHMFLTHNFDFAKLPFTKTRSGRRFLSRWTLLQCPFCSYSALRSSLE